MIKFKNQEQLETAISDFIETIPADEREYLDEILDIGELADYLEQFAFRENM